MPERNNYFHFICLDGSVFPVAPGSSFRVHREVQDLSKDMSGRHLGSQGIDRKKRRADCKCRGFLLLSVLS
jgi:hypothetical protein